MNDDAILREIRATRDAFAERHAYDIGAMVADLESRDFGGWRVVTLAPRRSTQAEAEQAKKILSNPCEIEHGAIIESVGLTRNET